MTSLDEFLKAIIAQPTSERVPIYAEAARAIIAAGEIQHGRRAIPGANTVATSPRRYLVIPLDEEAPDAEG